jgi:hypothetical protein
MARDDRLAMDSVAIAEGPLASAVLAMPLVARNAHRRECWERNVLTLCLNVCFTPEVFDPDARDLARRV